jgi:hypothetical protein
MSQLTLTLTIGPAVEHGKRGLRGHRRIKVRKGSPSGPRYFVSCICGWDGGSHGLSQRASRRYAAHLNEQIDERPMVCRECGASKPASQMSNSSRHLCKGCLSRRGNAWQDANPLVSARHKRNHHLRKNFGISVEQAEQLLAEQGGRCAVCGDEMADVRGYSPHVDHDHATGMVRGILCLGCNAGLGQFRDDRRRLLAAIRYLDRHHALVADVAPGKAAG